MKLFKKLAVACLSLTMLAGIGFLTTSATACGRQSESPATDTYKFKIVNADNTPQLGTSCNFASTPAPLAIPPTQTAK